MRGKSAVLLLLVVTGLCCGDAFAACDFGPDTCLSGFVWRDAFPGDHVCVTGATRTQAQNDNALAAQRRSPTGGAFGPDTCLSGFVWREASPTDHVCVTGSTRAQTAADNAQASARKDPQCAADTTPPGFVQNTITFYRVSDGLQVGSAVIPANGMTFPAVARDRRFVIASSAGDSESGVASIHLQGGTSNTCTNRLTNTATNQQGTLSAVSDEEQSGTAAAGNPLLRSAHFTMDPFSNNPLRLACPCSNDSGAFTVTITLLATNGRGLQSTSAPVTVVYAPQGPSCGAKSGEVCGNKTTGQVLSCVDGGQCDFKRSTVCSGWWIFRHCDKIQTTDMFCP